MKREDLKIGMTITAEHNFKRKILFLGDERYFFSFTKSGKEGAGDYYFLYKWSEIKEPRIEVLYECLDETGECGYYFDDGRHPLFEEERKSCEVWPEFLERKTGRTLKINIDNWTTEQ